MSIMKFDNIKVTTMTAIVDLQGSAIIETAFPLLPITRLQLKETTKVTKKFKIPWPGKEYAGCIFAAKYSGVTRGIIKTATNKSFRNSVAIDICTSVKNVSAKLVKNKIHMCGPNSEALAIETAQHIVTHLVNIQKELDYSSEYVSERDEVIKWLIKETKGDHYIINEETQEIIELEPGETIRNSIIYDSEGNIKYAYKEIPFEWESGDNLNADKVIVNKYGQPYYRSLTKKEKKDGILAYPLMKLASNVKMSSEKDGVPVDEKGIKFNKVYRCPLRVIEVTSVKYPPSVLKILKEEQKISFPKHINSRIATFLLNYIPDYVYHHIFIDFLENYKEISRVYIPAEISEVSPEKVIGLNVSQSETYFTKILAPITYSSEKEEKKPIFLPLAVGDLNIAMINYSYSINMNVDRWALATLIDGQEGFTARYNNTTDHHVTITLPYEKDIKETIIRKHLACISFMVYKSGIVTQSGPSPAIMEPVYYKFMNVIERIRKDIEIRDGKPFNIKYVPKKIISS